jgi:hypothetical protein
VEVCVAVVLLEPHPASQQRSRIPARDAAARAT